MTKAHRSMAGVGLALVLGFAGFKWWAAGAPVRFANQLIEAAMTKSWDQVFELGLAEERAQNRWTARAFSTLASGLTTHLGADKLKGTITEVSPVSGNQTLWTTATERRFRWRLPLPNPSGKTPDTIIDIVVLRNQRGEWRGVLGDFVRGMNRAGRTHENEAASVLRKALVTAGLTQYVDFESGGVLTIARLDRVLKGEIPKTEAWQSEYDAKQGA